eukprot:maker-scaffold94_size379870-snap-gene-0.12 protein:Tk09626 transcript:maker-scaffold94_size379870-snap-gene-0.12-mRNA-1 annotation:"hypothetical protein L798_11659"
MESQATIRAICSSTTLDEFLARDAQLRITYEVPHSISADFVSERTTGMPLPDSESVIIGVMAGLGIKRKTANVIGPAGKKAKTLSEKRAGLERDIEKYGLAAAERMYPPCSNKQPPRHRRGSFPQSPAVKMRPKPTGYDFEEVDARDILHPFSHDKYIHPPLYDSVVFIERRTGLVPLSSLCPEATTVMSSNVQLLSGRNVRLGKPALFVSDQGRLLAVGGSRGQNTQFHIQTVPELAKEPEPPAHVQGFAMDADYVSFALKALADLPAPRPTPSPPQRVDVRELKRRERLEEERKAALTRRDVINQTYEKVIGSQLGLDSEEGEEESEDGENTDPNRGPIHHAWKDNPPVPASNPNDIETRAIVSDHFKAAFHERKKNPVAGFDHCDVDNCYCRDPCEDTLATSANPTASQSPASGTQTPHGTTIKNGEKKVKHRLNKVKRALKSLGVNFYEFEEADNARVNANCDKICCRLGCICDTISGKPIPPAHCGKVECMFRCTCSEENAKYAGSKKIGISPAGAANLRSTLQRHLAAEERKFHNTVISSGRDVVMLGSSGRTKRERKIPSRYQDSELLVHDSLDLNAHHFDEDMEMRGYSVINKEAIRTVREHLENETIQPCTVIVPRLTLPEDVRPWCMIHCAYGCPCGKFKNPLDHGPDQNIKPKATVKRLVNKPKGPKITVNPDIVECENEPNTFRHDLGNHCARTHGYAIMPNDQIRLPHKVATKTVPKMPLVGPLSAKLRALPEGSIDLNSQSKGSIQYVKWSLLKEEFVHDRIKVFLYARVSRSIVFLTKPSEAPYVIDAINLKDGKDEDYLREHLTVPAQALFEPNSPSDGIKYGILTHNGLAWELSGCLEKKIQTFSEVLPKLKAQLSSKPIDNSKPIHISGDPEIQRVAQGRSLITLERSDMPTMQIKLPPTTNSQHWFIIRIDTETGSIQIPDTTLALKTGVLKQAANLAKKESTTVRIPIPVSKEVLHFGVYAVPGLETHVFVGPFSGQNRSTPNEVIDLDLDDEVQEVKNDQEEEDDDDDVRVIAETKKEEHISAIIRENKDIVHELVSGITDRAVMYGETRIQRESKKHQVISGPVPRVPEKCDSEPDIVTVESKGPTDIGPNFKIQGKTYTNLPISQFGKIVYNANASTMIGTNITIESANMKVPGLQRERGLVTFEHPTFKHHFVFSSSLENAGHWIKEYQDRQKKKPTLKRKSSSPPPPRLAVKPMDKLLDSTLPKSNGKKQKIMGVSSFINPNGSAGFAYLLESKEQAELSKLFYELGVKTCQMGPKRPLSQSTILAKAMEVISGLKAEEKVKEADKTKLKLERKDIFTRLKTALVGAPKEEKKRVLMSIKSRIRQLESDDGKSDPRSSSKSDSGEDLAMETFNSQSDSTGQKRILPELIPISSDKTVDNPSKDQIPPLCGATPYSDVTGLQTLKKGKISRPMNAFMLWAKDHRKTLIAHGYDGATVSKMLADEWKTLPSERKQVFYQESEHLKNLHQLQHPDYKYSPRARKNVKKPAVKSSSDGGFVAPMVPATYTSGAASSATTTLGSPNAINIRIPTLRNPSGEAIPLSSLANSIQTQSIVPLTNAPPHQQLQLLGQPFQLLQPTQGQNVQNDTQAV